MHSIAVTVLLWLQAGAGEPPVEAAMRLAARGDLASAERVLSGYVTANPSDADARYRLGVLQMRQQRYAEAAANVEGAIRVDSGAAMYRLALAEINLRAGQREKAITVVQGAAALAGDNERLWRGIATLQARAQDGLGEARSLQQILRLAPRDKAVHQRLAALLLEHRTADGAALAAAAGLDLFPGDAALLRLKALADYAMGQKQEALRGFLAAIDAAPEDAAGYASLETLLPEAGDLLPEVVGRLRRYVARGDQAKSPVGHFLLALAVPEEAGAQLQLAVKADPAFWPAHYQLGVNAREAGDTAAAIASLQTVLRLNPAHAESHYALAQLVPDREQARRHRQEHHRLRAEATQAEQARAAARPRINVQPVR